MHRFTALALAAGVLGCGDARELTPEFNVLQGRVSGPDGDPIRGTPVALKYALGDKSSTTDADGVYRIELAEEDYAALPRFFNVVAVPAAFLPASIEFTRDLENVEGGELFAPTDATVEPLDTLERKSIPLVAEVTHLGDSSFEGVANSQLQLPDAEDIKIDLAFDLEPEDLEGMVAARLELTGRGIEHQNLIIVNGDDESLSSSVMMMALSPEDGSTETQLVDLDLLDLRPEANVLTIHATEDPESFDWDDYEISVASLHIFKEAETECDGSDPIPSGATALAAAGPLFCIPDHDRNARQLACMAARTVDTQGARATDYGRAQWTDRDLFMYAALANFCFVLDRVTSPAGTKPVSLNANFADVAHCRGKYGALLAWVAAQPERSVTPLALFVKAMDLFGNDAVYSLAAISEMTSWHTYLAHRTAIAVEFDARELAFQDAHARFCATSGQCTGNVETDATSFTAGIKQQFTRANSIATRALIPITDIVADNGQFYHFWGFLTLNYIFPAFKKLATNFGGVLWESGPLKFLITRKWEFDTIDLVVDGAARDGGALLDCLIEDLGRTAPPTASTWWDELRCNDQVKTSAYPGGFLKNTKFLPGSVALRSSSLGCLTRYSGKRMISF